MAAILRASPADRVVTCACLGLLLAGTLAGIAVPAGSGWDFANFYDTGARVVAGQLRDIYDPSTPIGGRPPQGSLAFFGAPLSALFYAPLGLLAPPTALVLFKIQNTVAYFLALFLLYRHTRRFAGDSPHAQARFAALFAFVSLIYQPLWTVYRVGGQTTPTVFLLLTLGLLWHTAGRPAWTLLGLVTAVLIKPAFVPVIGLLVLVSDTRFLRAAVAIGTGVTLVSIALLGWPIHQEFLSVLARGAAGSSPWYYNSSLYVWLDALRIPFPPESGAGPGRVVGAVLLVARLLVVALGIVVFGQARARAWAPAARRHFNFLMAVTFCLLLSPTVWEHYLAALFLPLAYLVAVRQRLGRSAVLLLWGTFGLAIWQNLILVNMIRDAVGSDSFLALLAAGLLKSGPLLLVVLFLVRHRAALFETYTAAAWRTSRVSADAGGLGAPAGAPAR